jgi:iron-sulfur cluster repair protein YtfE (RIC family)
MSGKAFRLDMTMMYAMHHALRRELERIARITARPDDDPRHVLATAAGWEMFKTYLRVHHTSEDDAVWPVMQQALAGWPGDLALLEAMEAEHAAIDPLLNAMDAALADREGGPQRLGGLADELVTALSGHLRHEESKALPLIDATMTQQQWQHFGEVHRNRIGTGLPRYLPWLLEGTSAQDTEAVLSRLPQDLPIAYQDQWRPAYAQLDLWGTRHEPVTP